MNALHGTLAPFIRPAQTVVAATAVLTTALLRPALAGSSGSPAVELTTLVSNGLEENAELALYEEALAAAEGRTMAAARWQNPELNISVGRKRAEAADFGLTAEGTVWSVSVAQTFDFAGRIGLRKAIAERDVELGRLGLAQFRATLAARLREAGFRLFAAEALLEARQETADRFENLSRIVLQRDPAGPVPRIEARLLEGNALLQQRLAADARLQVADALRELNLLRGAPIDAPITIRKPTFRFAAPPPLEQLVGDSLRSNFTVRIRELELEQQGFRAELADREKYSELTVEPFYAEESAFDEERTVGIGLKIPIPLWTRNEGNVAVETARLRQAEAMVRVMRREVESELRSAAARYSSRLEEMALWPENAFEAFRSAAADADEHYRLGALPLATYVAAQEQAVDVLASMLATQEEAVAAAQEIEVVSGAVLLTLEPASAGNAP